MAAVLWRLDGLAERGGRETGRRAGAQEIIVADARQHLQLRVWDRFGGDEAVGVRRGHRIGVTEDDGHRDLELRQPLRGKRLHDGRRDGEGGADARDGVVVASVRHLGGDLGLGERMRQIVRGEGELLLRRADAVGGMAGAKGSQAAHVDPGADADQGREAAGREARDADTRGVEMRPDVGVGLHGVQRRAQILGPVPPQDGACNCHPVGAIVAGVVDGHHHIARLRQGRPEPPHHPGGAAEAVREQNDRVAPIVRERRVGRDGPDPEQRVVGRQIDPLFGGARGGRIPDGHPHVRPMLGVAQGRGRVGGGQVALAHGTGVRDVGEAAERGGQYDGLKNRPHGASLFAP